MIAISPWLRMVLLSAALFGVSLGCGREDDRQPEKHTPPSTSATDQQPAPAVAPEAPTSTQAAETPAEQLRQHIELPDYYPADAPLYPGTKPSEAMQTPEGRVTAVFGTADSSEQVSVYLREFLPEQGWTLTIEQAMEGGTIIQAVKPDRLLSVLLSRFDTGDGEELTIIAVAVDK